LEGRSSGGVIGAARRNGLRLLEAISHPGRSRPGAGRASDGDGSGEQTRGRVHGVWSSSQPTGTLTWGKVITGDAFAEAAARYGLFAPEHSILEIGPGYGRVLRACLDRSLPFAQYVGLDISEENLGHLRDTFDDPRVSFVHGAAETHAFDQRFDAVLSSLVFKHMYPSFADGLANVVAHANPGCRFCFDLAESTAIDRLRGRQRMFIDNDLYVRRYSRQEVRDMLAAAGLELEAFDEVVHTPRYRRLLVVARKPA